MKHSLSTHKIILITLCISAFFSWNTANANGTVILSFSGFNNCSNAFTQYPFNNLTITISQLDNIQRWDSGLPMLESISGVNYSGSLNTRLNYQGNVNQFGYHNSPNVAFTFADKTFPFIWFGFSSSDKINWTGSVHLKDQNGEICGIDVTGTAS